METRANITLVISFVAVIVFGAAIGAIVLLNLQPFPDTRAFYEIHFRGSVVGLKVGAPVSLSGIPIGNVRKVQIDPVDPAVVDVTIEVQKGAAIRTDSLASLDVSLVFGDVSISITGGSDRAPLLAASAGQPYPIIPSTAAQLTTTQIEELISRTIEVSDLLIDMLDEKGRQGISERLQNAEQITASFAGSAERFGRFIDDTGVSVQDAHRQATALTTKLDDVAQTVEAAQTQLDDIDGVVRNIGTWARDLDKLVQGIRPEQLDLTQNVLRDVHGTISQMRVTVSHLARYIDDFARDPVQFLFGKPRAGYKPKK
jgi:phospholipid/cholesterol/gamma-HCH transport system substrate-binding protein